MNHQAALRKQFGTGETGAAERPQSSPRDRTNEHVGQHGGGRVVAIGGGHGLAATLRGVRAYAGDIAAVVSVADDGGSSGVLRNWYETTPPGDIRRAIDALSDPSSPLAGAIEWRFDRGSLRGHPIGNLLMLALAENSDNFASGVERLAALAGCVGRVYPAAMVPLVLTGEVEGVDGRVRPVRGQVAVSTIPGTIRHVAIEPAEAEVCPGALDAILRADQCVLSPGSLYTSLLPALLVPEIRNAVNSTDAEVLYLCNLGQQLPETEGMTAADHVEALLHHGVRVDCVIVQQGGPMTIPVDRFTSRGIAVIEADLARPNGTAHDSNKVARVLASRATSVRARLV